MFALPRALKALFPFLLLVLAAGPVPAQETNDSRRPGARPPRPCHALRSPPAPRGSNSEAAERKLKLDVLEIRVRSRGTIAETTITARFANPGGEQSGGRLQAGHAGGLGGDRLCARHRRADGRRACWSTSIRAGSPMSGWCAGGSTRASPRSAATISSAPASSRSRRAAAARSGSASSRRSIRRAAMSCRSATRARSAGFSHRPRRGRRAGGACRFPARTTSAG